MRIVFLGTSHGVPESSRCCSSIMLEIDNSYYLIDMGTQAIEQLNTKHIPIESVKAIFITHMHGDHTNGLLSYIDLCSWYYKNANPSIFLPEPMDATTTAIENWLKCNGTTMGNFDFSQINEGLIYRDSKITVTAYKTRHTSSSYAFLIETDNKRVLFSGDLSSKGPTDDFPLSVLDKYVDLAICEAAHFQATAYLPIFSNTNNIKNIGFTHYIDSRIPSILEVKKALPDKNIFLCTDGMEITI